MTCICVLIMYILLFVFNKDKCNNYTELELNTIWHIYKVVILSGQLNSPYFVEKKSFILLKLKV